MEYSVFSKLATQQITHLYDLIERIAPEIDMDILSDVLHIYTEQGEYVINQHSPSEQIWLSSPVSNAGYFSYYPETEEWLDKNQHSLPNRLLQDLGLEKAL